MERGHSENFIDMICVRIRKGLHFRNNEKHYKRKIQQKNRGLYRDPRRCWISLLRKFMKFLEIYNLKDTYNTKVAPKYAS